MHQITVGAKLVGHRSPIISPLLLDFETPPHTLRELLTAIVRQQVAAFQASKSEAQILKVLTERELEAGIEEGRILSGGLEADSRLPDPEDAIAVALGTFLDGFYFVFVNGIQIEDLEHPVQEVKEVMFLRLTPLVGG